MHVSSVTDQFGTALSFSQQVVQFEDFSKLQVNRIIIQDRLLPHECKKILITYDGYLLGYAETGMKYVTDRISPDFTLIRMDAYAYPLVGVPNMTVLRQIILDSDYGYKLKVTVPDSLVVINSGILESKTKMANNEICYKYKNRKVYKGKYGQR